MDQSPAVAAVLYPPESDVDDLLWSLARRLAATGARIGGVVQSAIDGTGRRDMALVELRSGERRSIAQKLGPLSTSCKLDTAVIAEVAARLERQIDAGLDLMILNRFGKVEIDGGGFRSTLERAMLRSVPLLTAVRLQNADAWAAFHGGLGTTLTADAAALDAWAAAALAGTTA